MSWWEILAWGAAFLAAIATPYALILWQSKRYWDKYPNSLKEMQKLDDELCRREGRL